MNLLIFLIVFGYLVYKYIKQNEQNSANEQGLEVKINSLTNKDTEITNEPLNVVLKDSQIDVSKIKEYNGQDIKQYEFRPRNFAEFIAQDHAKEQAKTIIKKIKRGMKGHLFLSARQGMGKTSFVKLLANELNAKVITRIGRQLNDPDEIVNVINEINTSLEQNIIWFVDEIDSMDKKSIKILNSIVEQFELSGKKIKPFIFAGASINKDILIKNNPDFLDRIGHHIHFSPYSANDILKIIRQYRTQLYPNDIISDEVLNIISLSCKFCPRIAISLLEDYIVEKDIKKVLTNRKIIKEGLTEIDIKILKVLSEAIRPMGSNAVSLRAGLNERQYLQEFEPYLYEMGYINRVPSRIISDKGRQILKELKDKGDL